MKEKIKNLIFLAVLGGIGYVAYQYLVAPWFAVNEPNTSEYSLFIPEECQQEAESLRAAFNRYEELGNLSEAGLNGFKEKVGNCLKRADYAEALIDEAIEMIRNSR